MAKVADSVLAVLMLAAAVATVVLAHRAVRHWRGERPGGRTNCPSTTAAPPCARARRSRPPSPR